MKRIGFPSPISAGVVTPPDRQPSVAESDDAEAQNDQWVSHAQRCLADAYPSPDEC